MIITYKKTKYNPSPSQKWFYKSKKYFYKESQTGRRSHYSYGRRVSYADGHAAPVLVDSQFFNGVPTDYISNTVINVRKDTITGDEIKTKAVLYLVIDVDASKCHKKYRDPEGGVDFTRVQSLLKKTGGVFMESLTHVVRSQSGQGCHLFFAVSPMTIKGDNTEKCKCLFLHVQSALIRYLESKGVGADPCAVGLDRFWANFKDKDRLLYQNKEAANCIWKERPPILKEMSACLKPEKAFRIWNHNKTEGGLAALVMDVLDTVQLCRPGTYTRYYTVKELVKKTGLTRQTLSKLLKTPPAFLKGSYNKGDHEWSLTFIISNKVLDRVFFLRGMDQQDIKEARRKKGVISRELPEPREVEDGSIHHFVFRAALAYKVKGIEENKACSLLKRVVCGIDGFESSWSCTHVPSIIRSLYGSRDHLFGVRRGDVLPSFLSPTLERGASVYDTPLESIEIQGKNIFSKINVKKLVEGIAINSSFLGVGQSEPPPTHPKLLKKSLRKVSIDRFFKFQGGFYSAPPNFLCREVFVVPGEGSRSDVIHVFDAGGGFLCSHSLCARGGYRFLKEHGGPLTAYERSLLLSLTRGADPTEVVLVSPAHKLAALLRPEYESLFIARSKQVRRIFVQKWANLVKIL
jgi:hypothetical protein